MTKAPLPATTRASKAPIKASRAPTKARPPGTIKIKAPKDKIKALRRGRIKVPRQGMTRVHLRARALRPHQG